MYARALTTFAVAQDGTQRVINAGDVLPFDDAIVLAYATAFESAWPVGAAANRQTNSYTAALSDAGKVIEMNKGTANALTVPPAVDVAFPVDSYFDVLQYGAGATTITAGAGVTVNVLATKTLVVAGRWGLVRVRKVATNTWYAAGDLTAA